LPRSRGPFSVKRIKPEIKPSRWGADKLGEPYNEVENEYLKLTTAIERDNLSYAQEKAAEVQAAFRDLEIMAIKNNAIGNVRQDDGRSR
jgi:hypothetical protein